VRPFFDNEQEIMTTITCTQCNRILPGNETDVDEEQILVPERYSTIIRRFLQNTLSSRDTEYQGPKGQRDAHNTFTWESLLDLWGGHAAQHKLPTVAGERMTFINRAHDDPESDQDEELGSASLSYVRAVDEMRNNAELVAFPGGEILYLPHGDERRKKASRLIEAGARGEYIDADD
jgi:hypothetical protein